MNDMDDPMRFYTRRVRTLLALQAANPQMVLCCVYVIVRARSSCQIILKCRTYILLWNHFSCMDCCWLVIVCVVYVSGDSGDVTYLCERSLSGTRLWAVTVTWLDRLRQSWRHDTMSGAQTDFPHRPQLQVLAKEIRPRQVGISFCPVSKFAKCAFRWAFIAFQI